MGVLSSALLVGTGGLSDAAAAAAGEDTGIGCTALVDHVDEQPDILAGSSVVVGGTATAPAHCRVELARDEAVTIVIALPLSEVDGGSGGSVDGAWNGDVVNRGGGGYAGSIQEDALALPLRRGYVGSVTDTGHSAAWCNAVNPETQLPNAQPDCGVAGAGFVLDPLNNLIDWQVEDFITRSLYLQTRSALDLTKAYYGQPAERNYWVGFSTGGRQGWEMAQRYGELFDGFVVGGPAMNWNRFIVAEAWPAVVVNEILGPVGLSPAKSQAANEAAVAACDPEDRVADGIITEPRRCDFDATALLCPTVPTNPLCLTPAEARTVNLIWDGPRTAEGERLWGGLTKGTSFDVLLPGGNQMGILIEPFLKYWLYEDAAYDWRSHLTMANFEEAFLLSYEKFRTTASTDDIDLSAARESEAKIIHYHGISDPLIVPFGSHNYADRLFEEYGVRRTQEFVRSFFFPGVGHTPPTLLEDADPEDQLLDALERWVENDVAPDYFVQSTGEDRTRKVCAYPNEAVYVGGNPNSEASWTCQINRRLPRDLAEADRTVLDGHGTGRWKRP